MNISNNNDAGDRRSVDRLIIIGNGFDLAHGLKTSYDDFIKVMPFPLSAQFMKLVDDFGDKHRNWYEFENQIGKIFESLAVRELETHEPTYASSDSPEVDKAILHADRITNEVIAALKDFIELAGKTGVVKLPKVEKYFSTGSYSICFNYTDTPKIYTDNINYIHGSINDDNMIVSGYGSLMRMDAITMSPKCRTHDKDRMRCLLSFKRMLIQNKVPEKKHDRLLEKLQKQLDPVYSGKGAFDLGSPRWVEKYDPLGLNPYRNNSRLLSAILHFYRIAKLGRNINEFGERCSFQRQELSFGVDCKSVKEIVIMGHSIEADEDVFQALFKQSTALTRIVVFSYEGEPDDSLTRKIQSLKEMSGNKPIAVEFY